MSAEEGHNILRRARIKKTVKHKRNRKKKERLEAFPVPVLVPDAEAPPATLPVSSIDCYTSNQHTTPPKSGRFAIGLQDLESIVPWDQLALFLSPIYPEHGVGKRRHYALASMMRINLLQRLHGLSDSNIELALYDLPVIRRFAQLNCSHDGIPDIPTIERFRLLVEASPQAVSLLDGILNDFD